MERGFSYTELLIVIAIAGVIISFSMVMGMNSVARSGVIEERDLFVSLLLSGARAQSIANVDEAPHGIRIDNTAHQYVLFEGDDYDDLPASHRVTKYTNPGITVASSGGQDIIFEQLSGNVAAGAGTITISGNDANVKLAINDVGQIDW